MPPPFFDEMQQKVGNSQAPSNRRRLNDGVAVAANSARTSADRLVQDLLRFSLYRSQDVTQLMNAVVSFFFSPQRLPNRTWSIVSRPMMTSRTSSMVVTSWQLGPRHGKSVLQFAEDHAGGGPISRRLSHASTSRTPRFALRCSVP